MKKRSAGLLVYREASDQLEVLIVHPGGPFWAKKNLGAWSIPKGEYENENPLSAAKREFEEETGWPAPSGEYYELGEVKNKSGKIIKAWGVEGNLVASKIKSNFITIDWPPRGGNKMEIPEVDKAKWCTLYEASQKLNLTQVTFLERLAEKLSIQLDSQAEIAKEPKQQQLL